MNAKVAKVREGIQNKIVFWYAELNLRESGSNIRGYRETVS